MLRSALLVAPLAFFGCASPLPNPSMVGEPASFPVTEASAVEAPASPDAATFLQSAPAYQSSPAEPPRRQRERFNLKGGYLSADEDGLDDGYIINASWMRPVSPVVAIETEIGFLDASGSDGPVDRDVWAIPLMGNVRVNVPLGKRFEIYGGLGLGWFYYDAEADAPGFDVSADGFLFAGDAYFGGDIQLGESFRLGLEGKYYGTDSASELDGGLDSYVVFLTLGFDR